MTKLPRSNHRKVRRRLSPPEEPLFGPDIMTARSRLSIFDALKWLQKYKNEEDVRRLE
jgi:hypothetical protein